MSVKNEMTGNKDLEHDGADLIDKGTAQFLAGHLSRAESTFREALEALQGSGLAAGDSGKDKLAKAHQGLGRVKMWLAKFQDAQKHLEEADRLLLDAHGEKSREVLINRLYRSELCLDMEDYDQAYELARAAVDELKNRSETNDLLYAHALGRLGTALAHKNRTEDAEPLLSKALGIRSSILGEKHRLVGESLHDLAHCQGVARNFSLGCALERRAVKVKEESLGDEHPELGVSLYGLATQYVQSGLYSKSEAIARRGLAIFKKHFPEDHPLTIRLSERLASACLSLGQGSEAEELSKSALRSAERLWGRDNPKLVGALVGLGSAYLYKGDWRNAETYLEKSLEIMEKNPNLNTALEYQLLQQLSCCYVLQLKLGDAMRLVPDTFRARHTSNFGATIDLIRSLVEFAARKVDQASKGD